ncbi:MAG TPA: hypothetical protein VHV83_02240 [Armatimonadota bacterium]|nr:hypothetical protein [Armatimonadota bacterium]
MHKSFSAQQYLPRLVDECRREVARYAIDDDGTIYPRGTTINYTPGTAACELALKHGVAAKLSGDQMLADFTRACLLDAEVGLIKYKGHWFWANEMTPSLCAQGRWMRNAYYGAMAIHDERALGWLMEMMDHWPYLPEEHRFVERVLAGPQKATSVGGFSHAYNMLTEGAVDGWMFGYATGNHELMARCEDELENFVLPGQRDDGHWDYRARSEGMAPEESCGVNEFNYSFYTTAILSNLLRFDAWKERLVGPVQRSYDALRARFENADGSIYAPVHWGWGHIFESTIFSAIVAWRLKVATGDARYGEVMARALHWSEMAEIQHGERPLFWDRHLLEAMFDDFMVEGDVADTPQIIDTLTYFENKLATPSDGDMQFGRYYGDLTLTFPMQRKIQYLRDSASGAVAGQLKVPLAPQQSETVKLFWYRDAKILQADASFSWDTQYLYANFIVANDGHWQPYHDAELFRGDGIILTFSGTEGRDVRISLALTEQGPVVYSYNAELPYGFMRDWLPKGTVEGWTLTASQLSVDVGDAHVIYRAKLSWRELGVMPSTGEAIPFSFTLTKLRRIGWQHRTWGHDPFDSTIPHDAGRLMLVGEIPG